MYDDPHFIQAYDEIVRMLEGKDSLSFKRSEFLVEWAYLKGKPNFENYCNEIDSIVEMLRSFIYVNGLQEYKTAGNFALFEYFTKSNPLNNNKSFKYALSVRNTALSKLRESLLFNIDCSFE